MAGLGEISFSLADLWKQRTAILVILSTLSATATGSWFGVIRPAIAQVVEEEVDGRLDTVEEALLELREAAETQGQTDDATSFMLGLILQEQRRNQCLIEGKTDCE